MIFHNHFNKMMNIEPCSDRNCYNVSLDYSVEKDHIQDLIDTSANCYQDVTFNCTSAKFTHFASWTDLHGQYHDYFTNSTLNECECKKANECHQIHHDIDTLCNCDIGGPIERQDVIRITNHVSHFCLLSARFVISSLFGCQKGPY